MMGLRVTTTRVDPSAEEPFTNGFVALNDDGTWAYSPDNEELFRERLPFRTGDENGKPVTFHDGEVWIENLWKSGQGRALAISRAEEFDEDEEPIEEALLQEHPGHSNQLVHGRRGGGQQSLGLGGAALKGKLAREGAFTDAESSSGVVRVGDSYAEQTMATGAVLGVRRNGGGVTASYRVDIEGMGECYGKPLPGLYAHRLRDGIKVGQEFEREMGAHLLNQAMGGLVPAPRSVIRQGVPSVTGSQQPIYKPFTTDEKTKWLVTEPAKSTPEWDALPDKVRTARLAAWDSLIWNTDRHAQNVAYDSKSGATLPIDHSLVMPTVPASGNTNWVRARHPLDAQTTEAFKGLLANRKAVAADLRALGLPPAAVNGVFARAERMVKTGQTITASDVEDLSWKSKPWSAIASLPVPKPPKVITSARPGQYGSPHDPGRTSRSSSGNPGTTARAPTPRASFTVDAVPTVPKRNFPHAAITPHPPGFTSAVSSGLPGSTRLRPLVLKADQPGATLRSPHAAGKTSAVSSLSLRTTSAKKLPTLAKGATIPKSLQGPTFGKGATPAKVKEPRVAVSRTAAGKAWNAKFTPGGHYAANATLQSPHLPGKTSRFTSGEHPSENNFGTLGWWTTDQGVKK